MKRILLYSSGIIVEKKPTGGELRFFELAKYFSSQHDAELCCADEETELRENGLHADIHMNSPERTLSLLPEEARILLQNRKNLKQIAKSGYSDVIVFDIPPAIGLVLYKVRNLVLMIRKDLIGYERVKNNGGGISKDLKILYQWLCEELCLRKARQIICQCAYDRDVLMNRHPMIKRKLAPKFAIQINNCNPTWIIKRADEAGIGTGNERFAESANSERFRVGFVGGFDDLRKGQKLFLEAAVHLTKQYPEIEFVLVGGGKKLDSYRAQYESDRIRFYGRMENPLSVLKSCDLLAVPSLADSCPNTVMEALYIGIPVIGSRAGGIPEILQNDAALFSVDWESLAEKIKACYQNPSLLKCLRETQKARKEELSFDWAARVFELILESVGQE